MDRRILLLAAQVACSFVWAQPKLLDTPAARQFSGWLSAFNGTDRSAFRTFIEKNYPTGVGNFDPQGRFREQTGGFDLKRSKNPLQRGSLDS